MKKFEVITGAQLSHLFSHREKANEVAAAVNTILSERGKRVTGHISTQHKGAYTVWVNGSCACDGTDTHEALLIGEREIE